MLNIPLPFFAGLVFALTLHQSLKGVDVPGARRVFNVFLALYAWQGIGIGLRFGYGVESLMPFLPITAACMPPLAYLAFRGLTGLSAARPWLHILPPLVTAICIGFFRILVDPLLFVIFAAYAVALWNLTRSGGDELMAEATLSRMRPALRAARLTAALMLFFALSDGALAVYAAIFGISDVPLAVSGMNLVAIVAVLAYYFAGQGPAGEASVSGRGQQVTAIPAANDEDRATVARVSAALDAQELYRNENLSLARLARKVGLPARDLSIAINRAAGVNVSQFVNNRRVAEACRLLDETDRSVTTILFEVGFTTKSNFNREFRRVTGSSPRQWRARRTGKAQPEDNELDLVAAKKQVGNIQQA